MERRRFPWIATGSWLAAAGVLLVIGPLLIGLVVSPLACGPDANEGNCSWAAVPWLTFFTAPVGFLVILAAVVLVIVGIVRRRRPA